MKWLVLALIRLYQKGISPFVAPRCRFEPTCSCYAAEALQRFGFLRGSYLAARRLLHCNRLFPGGYDPVPIRFEDVKRRKQS